MTKEPRGSDDGHCADRSHGKREGETSLFVVDADGENTVRLLTEKHDPGIIALRLVDWR